jgi:hypothetical protein
MFILRESIWWMVATGAVGLYLGHLKGMARWGLLLGTIFGPIGWGLVLLLPARRPARGAGPDASFRPSGAAYRPVCQRCGKTVGNRDKACGHCGNVLVPIRYQVTGPGDRFANS